MKESEKYDPFIQQKLESLSFPDEHESWKRMELLLKKDRRRRPLFFIPIGCLGVLLITAGSMYLFYTSHINYSFSTSNLKVTKRSTLNLNSSLKKNLTSLLKNDTVGKSSISINMSEEPTVNSINNNKYKSSLTYTNKKKLKNNNYLFKLKSLANHLKKEVNTSTSASFSNKISVNRFHTDAIPHLMITKPQLYPLFAKQNNISEVKLNAHIKEKKHGIIIGLGVTQQIPINGQSFVPYGNDGRTISISDYLPYLYASYRINNKLSFEGQFRYGAPNYVRQVVYNQEKIDSFASQVHSYRYTIQKTYYHQLQIAISYKLNNKIDIGSGIQYNFFKNAIVKRDYVLKNLILNKDSIINSYQLVAKNDSFFTKHHLDISFNINYHFKRFDAGIKTGLPLSSLLNYQDASGAIKQEKSWYLNFYLRLPMYKTTNNIKNQHH